MKRKMWLFVFTVLIVAGFFMPWAKIRAGSAAKLEMSSNLVDFVAMKGLCGNDIPGRYGLKSYLVYIVPAGAVLILFYYRRKRSFMVMLLGIGFFVMFIIKFYFERIMGGIVHVCPGVGLWVSMLGYLGFGCIGLKDTFK